LAPTLKRNDIVMIDNLPVHTVVGVKEAIEAAGATVLYLTQYASFDSHYLLVHGFPNSPSKAKFSIPWLMERRVKIGNSP